MSMVNIYVCFDLADVHISPLTIFNIATPSLKFNTFLEYSVLLFQVTICILIFMYLLQEIPNNNVEKDGALNTCS